jgi:hypothetical protein
VLGDPQADRAEQVFFAAVPRVAHCTGGFCEGEISEVEFEELITQTMDSEDDHEFEERGRVE